MNIKDTIRIDINKNAKLTYYIGCIARMLIPNFIYRKKLKNLLDNIDDADYIYSRVNYYNKINSEFASDESFVTIREFKKYEKKKTYYFDLLEYLEYFDSNLKLAYLFGDIISIPSTPSLLKSRPIDGDNRNSILMKLDKVRHFIFVDDKMKFESKKNLLVWRGKAHQEHRQYFLNKFYNSELCNVGQIIKNRDKDKDSVKWVKEKLSLKKQLEYKFILTIEGNDVASNLKWVMSSNSIAFMVKPKYETWFMEGTLVPNHHYVLLRDDYSDLEEKILYYSQNRDEALKIIENAHKYVDQFKNKKREDIISLLVLKKYFSFKN